MPIESEHRPTLVVGISAVAGGGKTALAARLAEKLPNAVALFFDDYEESSVMPESFRSWFEEGADYDAFVTPLFTEHIQLLKDGMAVTSPVTGARIGPAKYIVVDAPLGRVHTDSGRYFDFMVFIDTPLDVAMARRLLRDLSLSNPDSLLDTVESLKAETESYLGGARRIYTSFVERVKPTCDLVVDGSLTVDEMASWVVSRLE